MQMKKQAVFWGALFIAAFAANILAASDGYSIVGKKNDFYFGHVSFVEETDGPRSYVVREADNQETPAVLNLPLIPGDTIVTPGSGRLELQFDNGTILRLDSGTEMKIETILAESLSTTNRMTNLVLRKGRVYVMFKEYSPREICQFLLPTAAVRLRHQTVAVLEVGDNRAADVRVRFGKAEMLYGPNAKTRKKQAVYKGERMTIGPDHRYALQPYSEEIPFEIWNVSQNAEFEKTHKGRSMLPKQVRKWPAAVQYFAEKYADLFGEWIYDDYLGYVWRPAENDHPYGYQWFRSGAGGWKPYFVGHWTNVGGQMFWVPDEPWGWIPYHLGVWHWSAKRGWLWVPGSVFAPAWVDWYFMDNYFAWQPLSFFSWMSGGMDYSVDVDYYAFRNVRIIGKVSKDQLAQPDQPSVTAMPREFKGIIKSLREGLDRRDPALLASLRMQREAGVAVPWDSLNAPRIQDRAVPIRAVSAGDKSRKGLSPMTPGDVGHVAGAVRTQRPDSPARISPVPSPGRSETAPRIHDWNPDTRLAARYGFTVRYNSRSNLVYSPELRMRSGDRWLAGPGSGGGFSNFVESGGMSGNAGASTSSSTIHPNTSPAGGHSGGGAGGGGGAEKK
jgi:hypothetical protein